MDAHKDGVYVRFEGHEAAVERLREAFRQLRLGICLHATDTVWAGPAETAVDFITRHLADEWTEQSLSEPQSGEQSRVARRNCAACGHEEGYHFDNGHDMVACRYTADCKCKYPLETLDRDMSR